MTAADDPSDGRQIRLSCTPPAYSDEVGRVFRPEVGHRADVKRATYSDAKRAIWDAPAWVVGDILSNGAEGQASSAGAHRLRRLSPARSMRYAL